MVAVNQQDVTVKITLRIVQVPVAVHARKIYVVFAVVMVYQKVIVIAMVTQWVVTVIAVDQTGSMNAVSVKEKVS